MKYDNKNSNWNANTRSNQSKNVQQSVLDEFYNPYGFVQLPNAAFTMTDQEKKMLQFCHDIPFQRGMSGSFEVVFEAITPFCVGSRRETEKLRIANSNAIVDKEVAKCPKIGENFYVPGSSIKGMIENVFRIITFSKMGNYIDNNRYSVRELKSDSEDYDLAREGTNSGFLVEYRNNYYILPCDNQKVRFGDITDGNYDQADTLERKYENRPPQETNENFSMWMFSGKMNGKLHEHSFSISKNQVTEENLIEISEQVWTDFLFIHQQENENKAWKYWKKKMKSCYSIGDFESFKFFVPVFYRMNENGNILDLGFSRLYRQPYRYRIHDCLPAVHKPNNDIDLTQAVFGYAIGDDSLKGRVSFSNAKCSNTCELSHVYVTAGSPKPSFYPFYLKQQNGKNYSTYGSVDARINGYKRFLLRRTPKESEPFTQPKQQSVFKPLKAGTKFTCKIAYHNLRPFELGALLNAIDFFGEECFHLIGYAKPLGYGKIKVSEIRLTDEQDNTRDEFEEEIGKRTNIRVSEKNAFNTVLSQLLFLSSNDYQNMPQEIRYPTMQNKQTGMPNEFKRIKQEGKNITNFNPHQ